MNEKQTLTQTIRPTKKQRELLAYISDFIAAHGYSPSYREIMAGLGYTSVATVALHVRSLIVRGHLRKRDYSARSLEVVGNDQPATVTTNLIAPSEEKWLVGKVEHLFSKAEQAGAVMQPEALNGLYVVVGALRVLGLEAAAQSFQPRLQKLQKQQSQQSV